MTSLSLWRGAEGGGDVVNEISILQASPCMFQPERFIFVFFFHLVGFLFSFF